MRTTIFLPALALACTVCPVLAAPKAAPKAPPTPPKSTAKLPRAKPTPAGQILTLKPGQTRLTPEQLALVTGKPAPKKTVKTPATRKRAPVKKGHR